MDLNKLTIDQIPEDLKKQIADEAIKAYRRTMQSNGGKTNKGKKKPRLKKHPNQSELSRKAVNARWAKYRAAKAAEEAAKAEKKEES